MKLGVIESEDAVDGASFGLCTSGFLMIDAPKVVSEAMLRSMVIWFGSSATVVHGG